MQKWEYMFVQSRLNKKFEYKPTQVNGQELRDWERGPAIHDFANQMGEQSWELIESSPEHGLRLIFKRPKP